MEKIAWYVDSKFRKSTNKEKIKKNLLFLLDTNR